MLANEFEHNQGVPPAWESPLLIAACGHVRFLAMVVSQGPEKQPVLFLRSYMSSSPPLSVADAEMPNTPVADPHPSSRPQISRIPSCSRGAAPVFLKKYPPCVMRFPGSRLDVNTT